MNVARDPVPSDEPHGDGGFPIVICGCHGGGTSYLAKLLRHSGLFVGADAGPPDARKYHESRAFLDENRKILARFGDEKGMMDEAVEEAIESLGSEEDAAGFAQAIDRNRLLSDFWGGDVPCGGWGWKDPRNSITYPVWKRVFPGARAIVLTKCVPRRPAISRSGHWFRNLATQWIRDRYTRPCWMDRWSGTLTVSFERITSEHEAFNELLDFCQLPPRDARGWQDLLESTGFEHEQPAPIDGVLKC